MVSSHGLRSIYGGYHGVLGKDRGKSEWVWDMRVFGLLILTRNSGRSYPFFFISLLLFLLQYIWRFVRCNINVFVPAITIDWLKQSKRHSCQQSNNVSKTFKTNLTNHFHLISPSINTSYAYVRAKV